MSEIVPKKTILVSKLPNQYPICWPHIYDENETVSSIKEDIPSFDVEITRTLMEKNEKVTSTTKNNNSEDEDWEQKFMPYMHLWNPKQANLFKKVAKLLDSDRLARLSIFGIEQKPQDLVRMRIVIDKSAERMRKELAAVSWEVTLVQWLHTLLMENLPPSLLAAYLDIMQTLKAKVPSLVDKMIFWKPGNVNQDLLASILKKPWQPTLTNKYRKLPANALIVVIPPLYRSLPQPPRIQRLFTLFTTMSPILPIQLHTITPTQSLQSCAEQIISITRSKIQELKAENPDRRLMLIGMHSSASLALQVALIEQVSGVVCFGFSYNTVLGCRGQPDDQILNTNCPVLLMIGQNAAKTNDEELEFLREKLNAHSSVQIAVVGGADDYLRVCKKKRRFEGVTQEMVDNMIVDEITDFATNCIQRPIPTKVKTLTSVVMNREIDSSTAQSRKRKVSNEDDEPKKAVRAPKMKSIKVAMKTHPVSVSSSEMAIEMAVQSITSDNEPHTSTQQRITTTDPQKMKQISHIIQTIPKQVQQQVIRQKSIIQIPRGTMESKKVPQQQTNFSPPKFTIVRSASGAQQNIYDMPIVFADSDGNVVESQVAPKASTSETSIISIPSDSSPSSSSTAPTMGITKKLILKASNLTQGPAGSTFTLTKNKNILIQKPSNNKMVVLNSIVGRPISASNIVIPSGSGQNITTNPIRFQKSFITTVANSEQQPGQLVIKPVTTTAGRKIEILNNQIIKPATHQIPSTISVSKPVTFLNLADAKQLTTNPKISISTNSVNVKSGQLIVKTANLKPLTLPIGTKQFGNLTVSKLNIAPSASATNIVKKNP